METERRADSTSRCQHMPHTRRSGGDGQAQPLGSPFGSRIPPPGPPGPDGKLTGRSQEPERGADAGTGHGTAVQTAWDRGGRQRQCGTVGGGVCSVGQRTVVAGKWPAAHGGQHPCGKCHVSEGWLDPCEQRDMEDVHQARGQVSPDWRDHRGGKWLGKPRGGGQAADKLHREGRGRRTAGREATVLGTRKLDTSPEQPGSRVTSGFRGGCRGLRNEKAQTCFPRSAWSEEGGSFSK